MGYEDYMSPEMKKSYLKFLNDPDAGTLKPEIKILTELLERIQKQHPKDDAAKKEHQEAVAKLEKQIDKLKNVQAKMDKKNKK